MNKNIYKVIGKKIYEKEDGKRYGMIYLAYKLTDGDGFAFTNYSSVYLSEKKLDDGIFDQYNVGDTVVCTYGWDKKKGQKYVQSAIVVTPEALAELEYVDLED